MFLIRKKIEEVRDCLQKWAAEHKILEPEEKINLFFFVGKEPLINETGVEDVFSLKIKDVLTLERCRKLKIGKLTRGHLMHRIGRGYLNFSKQYLDTGNVAYNIDTIGDLVKFSGSQLSEIKCFGPSCRRALKKIFKSLGIDWE